MDFRFTPEEEAFRQEVKAFLDKEVPPGPARRRFLGEAVSPEDWAAARQLSQKLSQKGWLTMAWPKAYGGQGRSVMEQMIMGEELAYRGVGGVDYMGIRMVGPIIIRFGTEEQKRTHLPRIARGEVIWCEGFSEPGSGSDLASLQTRAVADGDYYIINGQKVWTSGAHRADWCFIMARTDPNAPKHRGISFILVDMKTPGLTVRPIINMLKAHEFNEVFFDSVRVPRTNLVGEENRGWYVGAALLDYERSGIEAPATARRILEELVEYARETKRGGRPLAEDPITRHKLARMAVEIEVGRLLAYRVGWMQSRGLAPNIEASIIKLHNSELQQRLANLGMELLGPLGQLVPDSPWAPLQGRFASMYMASVNSTIAAGTSEVQRQIIAQRGLGLPRGA